MTDASAPIKPIPLSDQAITDLTCQLVRAASISPDDAGCQHIIKRTLAASGFCVESMPFEDVDNLWAWHGNGAPYFVFAGHTDVVPPGPASEWNTPPFEPTIIDGKLFGRGAADMKGSLAAMIVAAQRFLSVNKTHRGSIAFLITSDEEAAAVNGTVKVMRVLSERGIHLDWCLLGEPSSTASLGDVVRIGRRGSLHAKLVVKGIQGHVAYTDQTLNPIHKAMAALDALVHEVWDKGNASFPPTSMQISNIHGGSGITNMTPSTMEVLLNFRFCTASTEQSLKQRLHNILDGFDIDYDIVWTLSALPFLTRGSELIFAVQSSIHAICDLHPELSTAGGTSDGRFIAPTGTQVVELGPNNATIHKLNECVSVNELHRLSQIYESIIQTLMATKE